MFKLLDSTSQLLGCFFVRLLPLLVLCACSMNDVATRPQEIEVPSLEFELQNPDKFTLNNGIDVYYVQDDELPLIQGSIYFRGGALYEPADQVGLASATGSQMRQGGIEGIPVDEFNTKLESMGASIEAGFSDEYGSVGFSGLAEDFETILGYFSKVIRKPAFDSKQLLLWKHLGADGIRRRKDSADTIAQMTFARVIYGADSAYSRNVSLESINKISKNSMQQFHRRFIRPQGAVMALSGSIPRAVLEASLNKYLGDWIVENADIGNLPPVSPGLKPAVYLIEKDFDQAVVLMGHVGPPRLTPDMYAMSCFNRLFGAGSFDTALVSEVRSKLGLAYTIYGELTPGPVAGTFDIYVATRTSEVAKAIKRIMELVEDTTVKVPDETLLTNAKEAVKRSFVFKFDSSSERAERAALIDILQYPKNYDADYLANIDSVDENQVLEVAKRWIHPKDVAIVIVGAISAEQLEKELGQKVHSVKFDTVPVF